MFDLIIAKILQHEGGYVNDPDDLGGETKYGITKRRYPNLDIKNLTKKQAITIYKRDFYIPLGIDKFDDINLALNYMDMAVNAGIPNARTLMRNAEALKDGGDKRSMVEIYKDLRRAYYYSIVEKRPVNQKFLKGWLNRVDSSYIV